MLRCSHHIHAYSVNTTALDEGTQTDFVLDKVIRERRVDIDDIREDIIECPHQFPNMAIRHAAPNEFGVGMSHAC